LLNSLRVNEKNNSLFNSIEWESISDHVLYFDDDLFSLSSITKTYNQFYYKQTIIIET
jgi:hypothetical protein